MNKFYMVYVDGQQSPTYKHPNFAQAKQEAKRLTTRLNTKAWVLATVSSYHTVKIEEENCLPDRIEIPF